MKRALAVISLLLAFALLLMGCDKPAFTMTSAGNKITINVNDAADGADSECGPYSVGKGKTAYVESALESGALKIDFTEATVFRDSDSMEEVILGSVAASITVGAGEQAEVPLGQGDYVLQLTTVGTAKGKVTVNIK